MGTIRIVSAAMTGTHEQAGLRKPADRTSEMRAVDGKNLERLAIHIPYPARNICGLPVCGSRHRVPIGGQPRLPCRKLAEWAEREPGFVSGPSLTKYRRKDVADDRNREEQTDGPVEENSKRHEHAASRKPIRQIHRMPPSRFRALE
jgi:hypothetical protein